MKYIVANWKQNFTLEQAHSWFDNFKVQSSQDTRIVIATSSVFLADSKIQQQRSRLSLSAQNVSPFTQGKHTGQIGAHQLTSLVDYCLVGHPEVRNELGDTNKIVTTKAKLSLKAGLTPIVCVDTANVDEQVKLLKHELLDLNGIIIAFEPLESVGTGKPLLASRVNEMCFKIKTLTNKACPVLYGGSVTPDIATTYLSLDHVDGFLIGKASLEPAEFAKIISCATVS